MKKTLRALALAVFALPLVASAQFTLEEVWVNGVKDGVANPIPGLDGGWGKPTATNPGTATVSRFAVGKGGKIYTTSHKDNAIVTYDGEKVEIFAKLSPVTVTSWNGNDASPADAKWNGTAITTDDAGNIIFNYCFIDKNKSVQEWGVATPDGKVTDVTLSTPVESLGLSGRLDIIGHIVGDVTSEKGGIGYANTVGSGVVVMYHFKGDGTKVTSLTAKASPNFSDQLGGMNGLVTPSPKYATVDEILASDMPECEFYAPYGNDHPDNVNCADKGLVTNFTMGTLQAIEGIGNRRYYGSAIFTHNGKQYMVRNYVDNTMKNYATYTTWKGVMTIGVFDMETKECVASWMGSEYSNGFGMGTISVDANGKNTFNIYTYAATGSADTDTGTTPGCYCAVLKLTIGTPEVAPDGTKEHPYEIATAEDLCNMWSKMKDNAQTYFVQTADIDMAGINAYVAPNGHSGAFACGIYYDGQNHVIKNFAPEDRIAGVGDKAYYCTSVFGVCTGTVKNLGIVDADVTAKKFEAGILAAFLGGGWCPAVTGGSALENVFVTGTITHTHENDGADKKPVGGIFGQSVADVTLTDCYAQVDVKGKYNVGGIAADNGATLTLNNTYIAGSATGGTANNLVANGGTVVANNAIAFGSGETREGVTLHPAGSAEGISVVQSWNAYNEKKLLNGLPALNWQDANTGINGLVVETEDIPAVYYNLQGVQVANPENGIYIVRRGNKVTKELVR